MATRYSSFLVRCWRRGGDERRIAIEHVQGGCRTHVGSLAAAINWIDGHCTEPAAELPDPPARGDPSRKNGAANP